MSKKKTREKKDFLIGFRYNVGDRINTVNWVILYQKDNHKHIELLTFDIGEFPSWIGKNVWIFNIVLV